MKNSFVEHMQRCAIETEEYLARNIEEEGILKEVISYSLLGGGKRFRPALAMLFRKGEDNPDFIKAACSVEMIHVFSLIHDDLPAMDNDDIRRGKPSSHIKFGEAQALLAGDSLNTKAFLLLSEIEDPLLALRLLKELADAALNMIEGQYMEFEGREKTEEYIRGIHAKKTGALIKAPLRMSGIIAGFSEETMEEITRYGRYLGELFQLTDDLLDWDKEEDFNLAKLIGREKSRSLISEIAARALDCSAKINYSREILDDAVFYLTERVG